MTQLVFVRHGETEWNQNGRWQGHANVPLSETGRRQAARLAEHLRQAGTRFDHVYASDLDRALETAQILASALGLPVHPSIELREIDVGGWSGLTGDEIRTQFAQEWALDERGEDFRRGGHGETLQEFQARVVGAIERLARTHPGERLLIATHGGTIQAALYYVQLRTGHAIETRIANTSLTELVFEDGAVRVAGFNDVTHLAGEAPWDTHPRVEAPTPPEA